MERRRAPATLARSVEKQRRERPGGHRGAGAARQTLSPRSHRWTPSVAALAWLSHASAGLACPVCFAAKNEASRQAFVRATAFMTALPLLLMTGLGLWAWWRLRQLTSEPRGAVHSPPGIEPAAAGASGTQDEANGP